MIDFTREVALKTLYKINNEEAFSNIALNEELNKNKDKLTNQDIGFISQIVYGVTSWKLTIDEIIKKYSNIKLKKISPWIINILRMGVYQIVFLDKVPKSAAVNESVNLAKRYGHKASSNFVNAILRKIEKKDYQDFFYIKDAVERISKTTSMPKWIVEKLKKEMTIGKVEEICKNSNLKPNFTIRINNLKTNKNNIKEIFNKKNITIEEGIFENVINLKNVKQIENLEEFKNGLFAIQDEVTLLPCKVLNPKEGQKVLDACSAPGGKAIYMAELMKNKGTIEAWDIHQHRVALIKENAKRLDAEIVNPQTRDATVFDEGYLEKFDKILLDVPCLGLGVLKRKPDIKWKKQKMDIEEIATLQFDILNICSNYLKKGGELVYSTCSILDDENEKIINKFIEKNPNFVLKKLKINEKFFQKFIENDVYLKVYQNLKTDGFFIVKIVKK